MKKSKRTGKPHCVIQRGNVKVPVYKRTTKKRYIEYQVPDHTSGKRKLLSFADEAEAKHKATEIAEAAAHGDHDLLSLAGYKHRILSAIEWLMPTGWQIDDACHLIFDASEIINLKQLLDACRFYKKHQPDKPFTPKLVTEAVREYQAMPHKLGWKRIKTFNGYLNVFSRQFSGTMLHDVDEVALKDFVDSKLWSPKSYNEFLRGLSIFYRAAQFRRWVPMACDPAVKIKRRKEVAAQVDIFQPPEVKRLLDCLNHHANTVSLDGYEQFSQPFPVEGVRYAAHAFVAKLAHDLNLVAGDVSADGFRLPSKPVSVNLTLTADPEITECLCLHTQKAPIYVTLGPSNSEEFVTDPLAVYGRNRSGLLRTKASGPAHLRA
ncbi:MAG: hypothetical protein QM813_14150 [Verrucomicrobiota bacterium]